MAKKPVQKETPAPVDHTPAMPEQVRRQVEEANRIREQMAAGQQPPAENDDPGEGQKPQQPPQPPAPQPQPPQPPAPQPQPAAAGDDADQRVRSLSGRLEQERRTNQQLTDRINQLELAMARMQARGVEDHQEEQPNGQAARPKILTDQEVDEYGTDLLNVVGKRAREEFSPEFEQLAARLKRIEGRVDGVGTVIERNQAQELYSSLTNAVPNWRDINRSEEFKAWLQQPDAYSGRQRHELLMNAFTGHETNRVINFFKGFLTEAAGLPQTPQAQAPSAPPLAGNGNGSGKPSLEAFAAPGRARSAPQQPLSSDKPVYSQAWIAQFMADKRTGKYRGREADADAIERDIYMAQHEGRIQV